MIKVVWLCRFADQDTIIRFKSDMIKEFSPWINNLIKIFEEKEKEINLHIVAPNIFNNQNITYCRKHITLHFYRTTSIIPGQIYNRLRINEFTNYQLIKRRIKKIIKEINPDIIHLHGLENPIYSAGVLPFLDSNTVLMTVQGFISQDQQSCSSAIMKRKALEISLLKKGINFGVRTEDMCNVIKSHNPHAKFYWHNYPLTKPAISQTDYRVPHQYDCVFFARVSAENGLPDLLRAISIIKTEKKDISLLVVGGIGGTQYKMYLEKLCSELGITDNVIFKGFLPTQQLAYKEVIKAKVDVLPTYYDIIPGTILECMFLGVPVITYAVGGIPELNKERKSLLLVEKGDIEALAYHIKELLNDEKMRNEITGNAKTTVQPFFNNDAIYNDLTTIYYLLYKDMVNHLPVNAKNEKR